MNVLLDILKSNLLTLNLVCLILKKLHVVMQKLAHYLRSDKVECVYNCANEIVPAY